MITSIAINNYRSLLNLNMPLEQLNVITGPNGSGKSNLYKALRLLHETVKGGVITALANEGGLASTFWAGPEKITTSMLNGTARIEGNARQNSMRMRMGFTGEDFGYSISLGLPTPSSSLFSLDPEIKRECIWTGSPYIPVIFQNA